MSRSKDLLEEENALLSLARDILKEIGAIRECQYHPEIYIDNEEYEEKELIYEAVRKYEEKPNTDKKKIEQFKSALKLAMIESSEECPICKKNREE